MRDVAEHVGVSRQLVSLVLRGAPGPSSAARERILAAAAELGYHANLSARLLRQNRTHLVGALFNLRNPFEAKVVERLFVRAPESGFGVVLGPVTRERGVAELMGKMLEQRIEALVGFVPQPQSEAVADIVRMMPVVVLGQRAADERFDNVHIDELEAMRLAVEHLLGLGHRDIVYLGGGDDSVVGRDREHAFRAAMGDRPARVIGGGWGEEDGAAAARELIAAGPLPTAVVCCSDTTAVGALAVFAHAGIRVPQDVSVVGFDDSYLARLSYNALTSIRQDVEATVEETVRAVIARITDAEVAPRTVLTPPTLIVRASTGPAASRSAG
ncbi:LacI family DNA-binding transcriptional regulator [Microbacteriaceae bacterium VKM Ac-2854]|nr:LacI family DNA-binding transcriptional regulator [Microbacteriaceae bacterium VKM Ac-2854]